MPRGHLWGRDSALPSRAPPLHFARPPTPGASSWPGATLAIQGGIEGERRPHPSSGRRARREGEEKAPAALQWAPGFWVAALRCAKWRSARSDYGASIHYASRAMVWRPGLCWLSWTPADSASSLSIVAWNAVVIFPFPVKTVEHWRAKVARSEETRGCHRHRY